MSWANSVACCCCCCCLQPTGRSCSLEPPPAGCKMLISALNFNICRKMSAAKLLHVITSSGKVVATSFVYLMVHRRIAGDVLIYLKLVLKVTHPFRKRRFRQISLNTASAMSASKKVQLSLIGSRQCAFHRAIDKPCALALYTFPKGWPKTRIFTFCVAFHIFVAVIDTSNLACGLNIASPSLRATNCALKRRGHCHVTSFLTYEK